MLCIGPTRQFWWDNCEAMAKTFGLHLSEPLPPVDVKLGARPDKGALAAGAVR